MPGQGVHFRRPILASVSSLVGRRFSLTLPLLQSVSLLSRLGVSLTQPVLESVLSFVGKGVSRARPVLVCVSSGVGGEIVLHAHDGICLFVRRIGGLSGIHLFVRLLGSLYCTPLPDLSRRKVLGELLVHATCNLSCRSSGAEPFTGMVL